MITDQQPLPPYLHTFVLVSVAHCRWGSEELSTTTSQKGDLAMIMPNILHTHSLRVTFWKPAQIETARRCSLISHLTFKVICRTRRKRQSKRRDGDPMHQ